MVSAPNPSDARNVAVPASTPADAVVGARPRSSRRARDRRGVARDVAASASRGRRGGAAARPDAAAAPNWSVKSETSFWRMWITVCAKFVWSSAASAAIMVASGSLRGGSRG